MQDPLPAGEVPVWVDLLAVRGEVEQRGGRSAACEWPVVPDVGPQARGPRPAASEQRNRGVIAVQPFGIQDMGPDQGMDRLQSDGAGSNLIGQGREAEFDAFPGITLRLPVEWLMLPELLEEDRRQQVRPGPAAWRGMEGRRRLRDLLAVAAGELLSDGLDHLPLARDNLERLGDILAHLRNASRSATRAGARRLDHHPLARQVFRERLAGWLAPHESAHIRCLGGLLGADRLLGCSGLEFLELQLHLVDQPGAAFGGLSILLPPQLGDLEAERLDQRLRARGQGAGLCKLGLCRRRAGASASARASDAASAARKLAISEMASDMARTYHDRLEKPNKNRAFGRFYPAFAGRCVQRGLRQSIPSRR